MIKFFYGDESYQSSRHIKDATDEFLAKNPESDPIIFDCSTECATSEIIACMNAQGLFSKRKMIIIEDFFIHTKAEEQRALCDHLASGSDDMIIFYEKSMPRKNSVLYKWLIQNADVSAEAQSLSGQNLERWITKTCEERSFSIASDAVRELIVYAGEDLWKLSQEIDKLGCYAYQREITSADVELLVHGRIDADIFATIESVFSGDRGHALTLLKRQIARGDEGFHVFGMYAYQLRTLLMISSVASEENVTDKTAIAKTLKIHPFVVQKSLTLLKKTSEEKLKKLHKKLTVLDQDVKKGRRTIVDALELFIMCV